MKFLATILALAFFILRVAGLLVVTTLFVLAIVTLAIFQLPMDLWDARK